MPKTTNPRKTELHLYRLEPAPQMRERDEWAASTVKETCFVWATSAQEARTMVEVETRTRQSQSQTKLPFFSPWSSSSFTTCEEVVPGAKASPYPAGMVFTENGPIKEASGSQHRQEP
jgi:hypothetical protein